MSGQEVHKPAITATPMSSAYWHAFAQRRILLARCRDCGHHFHYPREGCPRCWGDRIEHVAASGKGTIWSMTTVYRPGHPAWQSDVPYIVALVRLDEGPALVSNVIAGGQTDPQIGSRVEADFLPADGQPLAVFRVADRALEADDARQERSAAP